MLTDLIIILFCLVGHAFFAGMETGVISIHRMRLRHFVRKGSYQAKALEDFLEHPDRLLGTTLVGTNILVVAASVIAASISKDALGDVTGEVVSTFAMSAIILVFCEYLPKSWFRARPLDRTRRFSALLCMAEWVFRPASVVVIWLTKWLVPGAEDPFAAQAPFVTREDLKILAREGEKDGVLSREERHMIHRVFELETKRARDIMVPKEKVVLVDKETSVEDFFDMARTAGFTRMPVRDGADGPIVGIINVLYILSLVEKDEKNCVGDYMRPPLFIPGDMPVDEIFPRLRRSRQPMALVRGPKGGVAGLVTTENILDVIVGGLKGRAAKSGQPQN